jgi:metal-responsive CopG/Arc/MetJ family transcriptional regulator
MGRKKRCTVTIDSELLERLQSLKVRTGLSESEQIRQGIRWWLASREWPMRNEPHDVSSSAIKQLRTRPPGASRRGR